jgi:hypothetical protein
MTEARIADTESVTGIIRQLPFALCFVVLLQLTTRAQSSPPHLPLSAIRSQCIEFAGAKSGREPRSLRECAVVEFGEMGAVDGETNYYAIYCLIQNSAPPAKCGDGSFDAQYGDRRALAIFARNGSTETARLLFERTAEDVWLVHFREKPQMARTPAGTLLYLPIAMDGTRSYNDSDYYLRVGSRWEPVDSESWEKDLTTRLRPGVSIWKGIWPAFPDLHAEAGLYREGDANCCPSGGTAKIQLALKSRRFVIESLTVTK